MQKWMITAARNEAELNLFPELNISGYITTSIAHQFAEFIPGPSTEAIISLA
jgi:predicted amidohydrolase